MREFGGGGVTSGETFFGTPGAAGDPGNQPDPTKPLQLAAALRHKGVSTIGTATIFGRKIPLAAHVRFVGRRTFLGRTVDVTRRLQHGLTEREYVKGPFLLVQQHLQAGGLPAALQTGTPQTAGACQGWSSTLPDGQHHFAFARGPVSVLLSSNVMSEASLVAYVAATMCR